jgi:hypothetical protein
MKFEVTDKRTEKEGLVFKKEVYKATLSVELTQEEQQALDELADSDEWVGADLGEVVVNQKVRFPTTLGHFRNHIAKGNGAWEQNIRAASADFRAFQIDEFKGMASRAKELIDARLQGLSVGDEDISVEL